MSRTKARPTDDELEEKVEFVMHLESLALKMGQIKREFRKQYGDTPHSTIVDYIGRARARMRESVKESREDITAKAINRYEGIFRDPAASPMERIRAQERIDKIHGIEAPTRAEHSGVDGGPIQIEQLIAASELTAIDVERALLQVVNVPEGGDV